MPIDLLAPKEDAREPVDLLAPKREYSTGQAMGDVQLSMEEGINQGAEFMADVGMFPTRMLLRANQGFQNMVRPDGKTGIFKRFWEGVSKEPEIEGVTIGDVTKEMFNPDELTRDKYLIPEGEGPEWLSMAKKGAKLTGEMGATAPMAGPKYLGQAVKAVLPSAAGGVAGHEMGGEAGELAGVIVGALAADPSALKALAQSTWRLIKMPPEKVLSMFKDPGTLADGSATLNELRGGMYELLRNVYPDDPRKAKQALEELVPKLRAAIQNGELGTAGQLLNDPGLLAMERAAAAGDRGKQNTLDLTNALISDKATAPLADIASTGVATRSTVIPGQYAEEVATEALERTGRAASDTERAAAGPLTKAKAAQEATEEALGAYPEARDTSENFAKTVGASKEASLNESRQAFGRVGGDAVTGDVIKNSVQANFLDDLPASSQRLFKDALTDTFREIDKLDGPVTIDELSDIISLAVSEANMVSKGSKSGSALRFMDDFQESLYQALEAGGGSPEARRKASAMYREHMKRYGPKSRIGKGLVGDVEAFDTTILKTGTQSVGRMKEAIAGDRKARAAAEKSLRALFKQKVIDPETGAFKPQAAKTFIDMKAGYGGHLESFPAFKKEIDAALSGAREFEGATTVAKEASKRADELRKVGEVEATAARKSTPATFAKAGDDTEAIRGSLTKLMRGTGTDRTPALRELVNSTTANPQAFEDLRRAALDTFGANSVDKKGQLTQEGMKQFKRNRDVYEKSGLYTADELDRIYDGLVEGQKLFMHKDAKRLAKLPESKQRVAGTLAALGGAKLGAYAFGSPLIGAALGRKTAVSWLDSITIDQAKALAFELTTNPKQFVDIFDKLDKQALTDRQAQQALKDLLARVASSTITGEE